MSFRGRVLHATPSFAPAYRIGGPVRSLEGLVCELSRLEVAVKVLTTDSNGDAKLDVPTGWTSWRGVPVRYVRRWLPPSGAPILPMAALESRRADVVHVTGLFSVVSMQALAAALLAKRPVVLSPRGVLEPEALKLGRSAEKRAWLRAFEPLLSRVALYHATSDEERSSVERAFGSRTPVVVVPNGTHLPRAEGLPEQVAIDIGRPRIGFIGRVHPIKALEQLIEASAILRDRGIDFELCIAGPVQDASYHESLRKRIAALSLDDRTRFEGELLDARKDDFFTSCRVLALPSRSENFGNVVVEALAWGTPVVASLGTPWRRLEEHGAGRWVSNDPMSLASALEPYLRHAELAVQAGRRGRRMVEERYTWAAAARAMCEAYGQVIEAGAMSKA